MDGRVACLGLCLLLGCLLLPPLAEGAGNDSDIHARSPCPRNTLYYKRSCYELVEDCSSWDLAEVECQNKRDGAQLVSILSSREDKVLSAYLKTLLTANDVWTGLHVTRDFKKLTWGWSDGSTYTSGTNLWDNRSPSTSLSSSQCISLTNIQNPTYSARWTQRSCSDCLPFVCKYQSSF